MTIPGRKKIYKLWIQNRDADITQKGSHIQQ